jgi:hypothetical protein
MNGSLISAMGSAIGGAETVELDRSAAEELFDIDFRVYGYGTKRALRSDRDDCELCAELGRAIEALKPMATRS